MQICWLTKQNRTSCILFFGGWGMDPNPFRDIPVHFHDLLMVYDYSRPEQQNIAQLADSYEQLHLVAWSMGVWAAAFSMAGQVKRFTTATAINGTLSPIDDRYGIEPKALTNMIVSFSSQNLQNFYKSMFTSREEADRFLRNRPQRPEGDILNELIILKKNYDDHGTANNIFGRKIVGSRDRVFPARNQVRSWGRDQCSIIRAPHFPFYGWSSWDIILTEGTGIA
ncbi:MAG: DUF452 family protein [Desulfobulbaceae bacterium]|nr:DUF452 family protein [Desulfobulbaceae bacterium]